MAQLFTNNAATTLASGITSGATSLTVATGDGSEFPNPTGSDFFLATLVNAGTTETTFEIVKCTARSTDTLTIVRAQDGTSAAAWSTGDKVELRLSALPLTTLGLLSLAGAFSTSGAYSCTFTLTANTTLTLPTTGTVATLAGAETLTNKTIQGGTHTALTSLGIRSTGAAFDLTMATSEVLTAGRTLSWVVGDAARSITLAGNLNYANSFTTSGSFAMTITATATSNATLPAGTDTLAGLGTAQTFTKAQRGAVSTLTDAATVALDLSLGNQYTVNLAGNRTLGAPTNAVAGQSGSIEIVQDTTGSRTLAYAWPYSWAGGTAGTLSTPGCTNDQLVYEVDFSGTSTVTITNATPAVMTWTGHNMVTGQRLQLTNSGGALNTGLSVNTTYWFTKVDANSGKLSSSLANCAAGTFLATSSAGTGTQTATAMTIKLALNKAYA